MGIIGVTLNPTAPPSIKTTAILAPKFKAIQMAIITKTDIVGIALIVN